MSCIGELTGRARTYSTYLTTLMAVGKSFIMLFKLYLCGSQVDDMASPRVATGTDPL